MKKNLLNIKKNGKPNCMLYLILILSIIFASKTAWAYSIYPSEGWDGPGLGSATLTYYFDTLTSDVPYQSVKETLVSAMDIWASIVDVTFSEVFTPNIDNSIDFIFIHPDDHPSINMRPITLAMAAGPAWHPYSGAGFWSNPFAGDIIFNDDFNWEIGNTFGVGSFDIMSVAVHELGHSLGLGHSDHFDSIMYPYISSSEIFSGLSRDDIVGIQSLYTPVPDATAVPEPTTLLFLGLGLLALVGLKGKYRRKYEKTLLVTTCSEACQDKKESLCQLIRKQLGIKLNGNFQTNHFSRWQGLPLNSSLRITAINRKNLKP